MKKAWHYPLLAALLAYLALGAQGAQAAAPTAQKPVAVVAFSGYSELKADVNYVGKLADNPELGTAMEVLLRLSLQNRGLEGLDKARPWGVIVQLDEAKFAQGVKKPDEALRGYGVLPVTDLKALLAVLEPVLGAAKELENGVFEVSKANKPSGKEGKKGAKPQAANKNEKKLYVKQVGPWAFLTNQPGQLAATPDNPEPILTALTKQYDLAFRFDLGSVPQEIRTRVLDEMKKKAKEDLEKQKGTVSEEEYAVRKVLAERTVRAVTGGADDLAELTLGWALDSKAGKTYLDVTVTARPDTKTARSLATLGDAQSAFAGFLLPDAAIKANWTGKFSQADSSEMLSVVHLIRKRAMAEIEKQPNDQAAVAAQLLDGTLDVIKDTLAAGRIDGGVAASLGPETFTVVAGGFVADGAKLDATLKRLVDAVCQEHPEAAGVIEWDAGEHRGVKLHAAHIPVPFEVENRDQVVALIGEVAEIVVGTGKESVYVAFGRDATKLLKTVLDKSAEGATAKVPPLRVSVDLGSVTKFLAVAGKTEDERQKAALVASLLEQAGQQDHVNLSASPVENGVQLRLEVEEGILKAAGKMAMNRGARAGK